MKNEGRGWEINVNIENLKHLERRRAEYALFWVLNMLTQEHYERRSNENLHSV